MGATSITRWIGVGLLGLPLYGVLTFFSSLNPQPDPNTHYEAFSRFVTSDFWVLKHLFASDIGLILAIFGPTIARRLTGYFAAPGGTKKRPRIRLSLT